MKFPTSCDSLLIRVDFSNDAAWDHLCQAAQEPSAEGFKARLSCVNDRAYDGVTVTQFVALAPKDGNPSFAFFADRTTFTHPELAILVVDFFAEPGRTFRVIPQQTWGVENNLSIANMDFCEFADNVDADGVFRDFPKA